MTSINVRRHPEPFQPGERVFVGDAAIQEGFEDGKVYEIKGPTSDPDLYQVWLDAGPRRYALVPGTYLIPAATAFTLTASRDQQYPDPIKHAPMVDETDKVPGWADACPLKACPRSAKLEG